MLLKISWHLKHGEWVNITLIFKKRVWENPRNQELESLASVLHKIVKAVIDKNRFDNEINTISLEKVSVVYMKSGYLSCKPLGVLGKESR